MARRPARYRDQDAERAAWAPAVARGVVDCRRGTTCRAPQLRILPGEPWDLGHPDAVCPAPTAPEHEACNRATKTWTTPVRPPEIHPALRVLDG